MQNNAEDEVFQDQKWLEVVSSFHERVKELRRVKRIRGFLNIRCYVFISHDGGWTRQVFVSRRIVCVKSMMRT